MKKVWSAELSADELVSILQKCGVLDVDITFAALASCTVTADGRVVVTAEDNDIKLELPIK